MSALDICKFEEIPIKTEFAMPHIFPIIKALQACNIPRHGIFSVQRNHFETRPFHAKFEENQ